MAFVETMKPRERVLNALAGKPVDRPPVCNPTSVFTVELMDLVDALFPGACRDPELAAPAHTALKDALARFTTPVGGEVG